jgi:hypothetical protein
MSEYHDEAQRVGGLRLAPFWPHSEAGCVLLAIVAASASVPWLIKMVM